MLKHIRTFIIAIADMYHEDLYWMQFEQPYPRFPRLTAVRWTASRYARRAVGLTVCAVIGHTTLKDVTDDDDWSDYDRDDLPPEMKAMVEETFYCPRCHGEFTATTYA